LLQNEAKFSDYTRLLTKRDICALLQKSPRTIEGMMRKRQIPYLKIGKSVRYRLVDIERALEAYSIKEVSIR
jgi:hypothetical protein